MRFGRFRSGLRPRHRYRRGLGRGAVAVLACVAPVVVVAAVNRLSATLPGAQIRLDHVPVVVRDLDAAVSTYRDALGFSIKPGRPHENSILNAHIKFADGSALELITAVEPRDELAARYLDMLLDGEGGAALALDAGPVAALARRLAPSEPFATVAESYYEALTFPAGSPLEYLFFIVVHRRPPDTPEHLRHANTAARLHAVWVARTEHAPEERLLSLLGTAARDLDVELPGIVRVREARLDAGRIYLVVPAGADSSPGASGSDTRSAGRTGDRPVVGVTVEVTDLDRAMASLAATAAAAVVRGADSRGRFVRVPPSAAHGLWLELLEPAPARGGARGNRRRRQRRKRRPFRFDPHARRGVPGVMEERHGRS